MMLISSCRNIVLAAMLTVSATSAAWSQDFRPYTSVYVYPNPAVSVARVRINHLSLTNGHVTLKLVSVATGEVLQDLTDNLRGSEKSNRVEFDVNLSKLSSGTYIMVLEASENSDQMKFTVVR